MLGIRFKEIAVIFITLQHPEVSGRNWNCLFWNWEGWVCNLDSYYENCQCIESLGARCCYMVFKRGKICNFQHSEAGLGSPGKSCYSEINHLTESVLQTRPLWRLKIANETKQSHFTTSSICRQKQYCVTLKITTSSYPQRRACYVFTHLLRFILTLNCSLHWAT